MEEDIFIIESFLKDKKLLLKHPCWVSEKTIQAIENLINKYKEQEKIIEIMAYYIAGTDRDEEICKMVGETVFCTDDECRCKECIIEFFKKKAR